MLPTNRPRRLATRLLIVALLLGLLPAIRFAEAAPQPAPILLIVNDSHASAPQGIPFGRYLGEILRAEGHAAYDLVQLSSVNAASFAQRRLVLLAETPLTDAQAALLTSYVTSGGRLIATRPDAKLAPLFGLTPAGGSVADGYLKIDDTTQTGSGLPTSLLQIHGAADTYTVQSGTTVIARLYSSARAATASPAVVSAAHGLGRAAAFTYNLAQNIVLTRQGNPDSADKPSDCIGGYLRTPNASCVDPDVTPGGLGLPVVRTIGLFQTFNDNTRPWIDRDAIPVPQADEQMRLLSHLIADLIGAPQPRLWYFPDGATTMLIATGDAHGQGKARIQPELDLIKQHQGRMTLYLSGPSSDPSDSDITTWRQQGHGFGIHPWSYQPNPGYPPFNILTLNDGYRVASGTDGNGGRWKDNYPNNPKSRTVRNHQIAWTGWTDAAVLAAQHGIAMDTSFYHWGAWLQKPDGSWPHGYITGSGQPMRFLKANGDIIAVYQQLTQLVDEQLLRSVVGTDTNGQWKCEQPDATEAFECLTSDQAVAVSRDLIDRSLAGDYAALMAQFHVDYFDGAQQWVAGTLSYAQSKNVPIWNADQWLNFTETRAATTFQDIGWNAATGQLTFATQLGTVTQATTHTLTLMLPASAASGALQQVAVDGSAQPFALRTIKGRSYAFVQIAPGSHTIAASYPATPPTPVTPTPVTPTPTVPPTSGRHTIFLPFTRR